MLTRYWGHINSFRNASNPQRQVRDDEELTFPPNPPSHDVIKTHPKPYNIGVSMGFQGYRVRRKDSL